MPLFKWFGKGKSSKSNTSRGLPSIEEALPQRHRSPEDFQQYGEENLPNFYQSRKGRQYPAGPRSCPSGPPLSSPLTSRNGGGRGRGKAASVFNLDDSADSEEQANLNMERLQNTLQQYIMKYESLKERRRAERHLHKEEMTTKKLEIEMLKLENEKLKRRNAELERRAGGGRDMHSYSSSQLSADSNIFISSREIEQMKAEMCEIQMQARQAMQQQRLASQSFLRPMQPVFQPLTPADSEGRGRFSGVQQPDTERFERQFSSPDNSPTEQ